MSDDTCCEKEWEKSPDCCKSCGRKYPLKVIEHKKHCFFGSKLSSIKVLLGRRDHHDGIVDKESQGEDKGKEGEEVQGDAEHKEHTEACKEHEWDRKSRHKGFLEPDDQEEDDGDEEDGEKEVVGKLGKVFTHALGEVKRNVVRYSRRKSGDRLVDRGLCKVDGVEDGSSLPLDE